MLTSLQQRVCGIVADLPEAETFALAGGAALNVHGIVDRATDDLDFFTPDVVDVRVLADAARSALGREGLNVVTERSSTDFVRLRAHDGENGLAIDFGISGRAFQPATTPSGRVLAGDKLLALFGRAEPRDFVDVHALAARFGLENLYPYAEDKDPGFSLGYLRDAVAVFDHRPRQAFPLTDPDDARLGPPLARRAARYGRNPKDLIPLRNRRPSRTVS